MVADLLSETGLSLDRLHSFCRVAEAGGVTRAAKGDATKQSLYSRQIKELEEFFGAELMRRNGRGIVLTPAGVRLHSIVSDQFASLSDFKSECQNKPLEIVIGAGDSIIQWLLLPKLPMFEMKLPNVRHKFLNLTNDETVRRLCDGLIDFGIVRKGVVTKLLRCTSLGRMSYSVFIPKSMELKAKGMRFPKLLELLPLAILEGEGTFRRELDTLMRRGKLRLQVKVECSSYPLVARSLAGGKLAGILPSLASEEAGRLGLIEFPAGALQRFDREICLAWNPRQLQVRTSLEKAREVLVKTLSF